MLNENLSEWLNAYGLEFVGMENQLRLSYQDIQKYIKVRAPFLLLDYALSVVPGVEAIGVKKLTGNEWFFPCHFPGNPLVPGSLQMEALQQTGALTIHTIPGNEAKNTYVAKVTRVSYLHQIRPGQTMRMETRLLSWKHGVGKLHGELIVENKVACTSDFILIIEEDMVSMEGD